MNYFKSTAENIRSLEKDDALVLCSSLIPLIHEIGSKYNIKFFDNYFYRTYAIYNETKQIWEDIQLGEKRTGRDAYSQKYSLKDIEFKTGNDDKEGDPLKTSFMWDKQSESIRRTETLGSDAFVLGRFEHEVLRIILIAREEKTLQHIRSIMENKQKDFLEKWNKNIADGKRGGSDAIRISYSDLLTIDTNWDIWIHGIWYKNINSEKCKEYIGNMYSIAKRKEVKLRKIN